MGHQREYNARRASSAGVQQCAAAAVAADSPLFSKHGRRSRLLAGPRRFGPPGSLCRIWELLYNAFAFLYPPAPDGEPQNTPLPSPVHPVHR